MVESAKNVESNFVILEKRADAICEDVERLKDWQLNGKEVLSILQSLQAEIRQMKGRRFEDEPTAFEAAVLATQAYGGPSPHGVRVGNERLRLSDTKAMDLTLTAPSGMILKSNCESVKVETTETRIKRIADLEQVLSEIVNNIHGRGSLVDFEMAVMKARKLLGEA